MIFPSQEIIGLGCVEGHKSIEPEMHFSHFKFLAELIPAVR